MVSVGFSIENPSLTRASSLPHESAIDDVYLLFFDSASEDADASLLGYVKAETNENDGTRLSFPIQGFLSSGVPYRVLALANADSYTPDGFDNYMRYLEDVITKAPNETPTMGYMQSVLEFNHIDRITYSPSEDGFLLPMEGSVVAETGAIPTLTFKATSSGYIAEGSLRFRRSVVRVDVSNGATAHFKLAGVTLCNYRTSAYPMDICKESGTLRGIPETDLTDDKFITIADEDSDFQSLEGMLYAFPNAKTGDSDKLSSATGVIIKGYYIENEEEDSQPSYYRVNLGASDTSQMLIPNSLYKIGIISVLGRGCSSADEAYGSEECLIELASGTGWNQPGVGYDVDEDGNFLVVTQPKIELPADGFSGMVSWVFASEGVEWEIEKNSGDEWYTIDPASNHIDIVAGANEEETTKIGSFTVIGKVDGRMALRVPVEVVQGAGSGGVEDWTLPPFALIPVEGSLNKRTGLYEADHVKVGHRENEDGTWTNTIEIDGFAPEVFNGFIDIPMKVQTDLTDGVTISVDNNFAWPLEGCVSQSPAGDRKYSWTSFNTSGTIKPDRPAAITKKLNNNDELYISVGAMGPDDPAIIRNITLSAGGTDVEYILTIKPRPVIIDDVILRLSDGSYIMVCDRNVQDPTSGNFKGWTSEGYKMSQAYHFGNYSKMYIPGKYSDKNGTKAWEDYHKEFGESAIYSSLVENGDFSRLKQSWVEQYTENLKLLSPFYSEETIGEWKTPSYDQILEITSKIKSSKMRMYILSDVPTADHIPIVCYLHYYLIPTNNKYLFSDDAPSDNNVYEYLLSDESPGPSMFNPTDVKKYYGCRIMINTNSDNKNSELSCELVKNTITKSWLVRLIRELSEADRTMYENEYLGYAGKESPLKPCIPDTHPYYQPYP